MSDTVTIRNKSGSVREIDGVGVCDPGDTIDVPAELANGSPPDGEYPGTSGLLAQEGVWEKATAKRGATTTPSGEED